MLTKAGQAKEKTGIAQTEEEIRLAVNASFMEGLGKLTYSSLVKELNTNLGEGNYSISPNNDDTEKWTIEANGYETEITKNGEVGDLQKSQISISFKLTSQESIPTVGGSVKELQDGVVPIPTGFYYVDGTKDTGVVISDVEGDNLNNTQKGNQFVWVPVKQNQKLTLEVKSQENIAEIILTMPDGATQNLTASGKNFNQEITMTKNGVYSVEVKTATTTKTAQKRITTLYANDIEKKVIIGTNIYKNIAKRYGTTQELLTAKHAKSMEQLLKNASSTSIGMYMLTNGIFVDDQEEEFKKYAREVVGSGYVDNNQNKESVNKYGGFYIARFEAGDGTTLSKRTDTTKDTNTLVSKKGAYVYNYIACEDSSQEGDAKRLASGMYSSSSSVTSQLITGAGWDRTLNWLMETGKSEQEVILNSSSWGNYDDSTGNALENSGSSNMNYTTGRSEYWKANNIYDIAGNVWEWTQEKYTTYSVVRGGAIVNDGNYDSAYDYINVSLTKQNVNVAFRVQLYIQ